MSIGAVGTHFSPVTASPVSASSAPAESAAVPASQDDLFEHCAESVSLGNEVKASSAAKAETASKVSQEQVETLLGQLLEDAPAAPAPAGTASCAVMGAADFEAAGLGAGLVSAENRVPTMDLVKNYQYIKPEDAKENYWNNVRPGLNIFERGCLKAYCTVGYLAMNGYMLGLKKSPTGTIKRAVQCAAGALESNPVPSGSRLYRTANINELRNYVTPEDFEKYKNFADNGQMEDLAKLLDARLQGTETHRKTFLSTTIDPKFNFEDKPAVATKIYVGEGVKGIYVADDKALTRNPEEQEYLLAPNTKVTVMGVDYDPKAKGLVLSVFLGDVPEGAQKAQA